MSLISHVCGIADQHSENSMSQSPSMVAITEKLAEIQPKLGIVPSFIPKLNEPVWKDEAKRSGNIHIIICAPR